MTGGGGSDSDRCVFLFDTTHHVMWAEDVARERRVPIEVIPAPPEAESKCGLAIRTFLERVKELEACFQTEGIIYRIF